jgi:uncharacterized protein (TIGR03000 family)
MVGENQFMLRLRDLQLCALVVLVSLLSKGIAGAQTAAQIPAPAKLKVFVPVSAVLRVDGAQTQATGEIRNFVSPPLPPGKKFVYTLRATWKEAGKEIERERTIRVEAGQESTIDFRSQFEPSVTADKDPGIFPLTLPADVVDKMLELAIAKKADVLCDPMCGDGQVLLAAVQKLGVRGYGYEGDPQRANEAAENVKKSKLASLVSIQRASLADVDFKDATVVLLHLSTGGVAKIQPQLAKLRPGTRIVSDNSELKGARPTRKITYAARADKPGEGKEHTLYLWIVPWDKE